jgi:hypothetical protein
MAGDDDFERADLEAGVEQGMQVMAPARHGVGGEGSLVRPSDIMAYRAQLVEKYHKGAESLVERLRNAGKDGSESLLVALIDEVVTETDHLLGNELVATQNGELRDASVISFKRAEVLEKAIKAVQAKHESEKDAEIDLDSPAMIVIIRYFMEKAKVAFEGTQMGNEVSDLFYRLFVEATDGWKKDLRERFEERRASG